MTSARAFRKGDVVAVAPRTNYSWDDGRFRIARVEAVMAQGVRVAFVEPKTDAERRGIPVNSSMVRFAIERDGRWISMRDRPDAGEVAPEQEEPKPAQPRDVDGEARALVEQLGDNPVAQIDHMLAVMKRARLLSGLAVAERALEHGDSRVAAAEAVVEAAERAMAAARSMLAEAEADLERSNEELNSAMESRNRARAEVERLKR